MKTIVVCFGLVMCVLSAATLAAGDSPTLRAVKTDTQPVIDGSLDDPSWTHAAIAKDFINVYSTEKANHQTEAYVLYDDKNLYIAYKVYEPELDNLKTEASERDGPVYGDDNVELFLDPANKDRAVASKKYFHIIVNSKGVVDDRGRGYVKGGKKSWSPNYPLQTGRGKGHWIVEMALPMKDLFQGPQMGNVWRLNFNRTRRLRGEIKANETSCWAPTLVSPHDITKWGDLTGLIIEEPSAENSPVRLREISLPPARTGSNEMTLKLDNKVRKARVVKATIKTVAPSGSVISKEMPVALQGKSVEEISLSYKIANETGRHEIRVSFRDADQTYDLPPATVVIGELLDAYLDRNYYTGEKTARVLIELPSMDGKSAQRQGLSVNVRLSDKEGRLVSEKSRIFDAQTEIVELDIASLSPGKYPLSINLLSQGSLAVESQLTLVKHPPAPEGVKEVKIDKENLRILVNGKPTFILGQCAYELETDHLKTLADYGLNTWYFFPWYGAGGGELNSVLNRGDNAEISAFFQRTTERLLAAAEENELMIVMGLNHVAGSYGYSDVGEGRNITWAKIIKRLRNNVPLILDVIKNHPSVILHSPFDEPNDSSIEGSIVFHEMLRENDPYHLVALVTPSLDEKTILACDLPFTDHYWDPVTGTPLSIVSRLKLAVAKTAKLHVPLIEMPALSLWSAAGRERTPMEMRCETYLILIHGARGGVFWFGQPPHNPEAVSEWKKLISELKALTPIILEKDPRQTITGEGKSSPIHALVKKHKGETYLLAANTLDRKLKVRFSSSSFPQSAEAQVLFEKRTATIENNTLEDTFGAYATHVYKIKSSEKQAAYEIKVSSRKVGGIYIAGLESQKYFARRAAAHSPYFDQIYIRGKRNTLKSVAQDIGNEKLFSYDEKTRTAVCSKKIYIAYGSKLTVGDKSDPDFHEVLKYSGDKIGSILTFGVFEAYNSKIVGFEGLARKEAARIEIANCELVRCRNSFRVSRGGTSSIRNCRIHNAQMGIFGINGPVVGCEIYDNELLTASDATFIDCKHYRNNSRPSHILARANMVFINTEDDYVDKYKFYGRKSPSGRAKYDTVAGSLTCKWYLGVEVVDGNNQPLKGARVVADTEGDKYDARGETDAKGTCRLILTQFYRDGEGRKDFAYTVKINTGEDREMITEHWSQERSMRLKYTVGNHQPERAPW